MRSVAIPKRYRNPHWYWWKPWRVCSYWMDCYPFQGRIDLRQARLEGRA